MNDHHVFVGMFQGYVGAFYTNSIAFTDISHGYPPGNDHIFPTQGMFDDFPAGSRYDGIFFSFVWSAKKPRRCEESC